MALGGKQQRFRKLGAGSCGKPRQGGFDQRAQGVADPVGAQHQPILLLELELEAGGLGLVNDAAGQRLTAQARQASHAQQIGGRRAKFCQDAVARGKVDPQGIQCCIHLRAAAPQQQAVEVFIDQRIGQTKPRQLQQQLHGGLALPPCAFAAAHAVGEHIEHPAVLQAAASVAVARDLRVRFGQSRQCHLHAEGTLLLQEQLAAFLGLPLLHHAQGRL